MLNINVGILGHVDSGKTSLAKALSTVSSTAAFDKSPQSHERGMTLDLGFSSFHADVSQLPHFSSRDVSSLQVTLVDCPGHASLIRTVIGGAQIVDLMLLVVDATKGIQTQTAECIVVGEVIAKPLIVVLNKVDAIQGATAEDREAALIKLKKRIRATMSQTRWPTAPICEVAADPGATGLFPVAEDNERVPPVGVKNLVDTLLALINVDVLRSRQALQHADKKDKFLMFVDHCFPIKGQGTVLTGTVMRGSVAVGDDVFLPDFLQTRRVKGIQVFRKPVSSATAGDRIGLCIAQFDAKDMERGIVCSPTTEVASRLVFIAVVSRVRYHKLAIEAAQKFHISIGHSTVMGSMRFFSSREDPSTASFDIKKEYLHLDCLPESSAQSFASPSEGEPPGASGPLKPVDTTYFAVVVLERPVTTFCGATLIASHLDTDIHANLCRLAVVGRVESISHFTEIDSWRNILAVKYKHRRLVLDRVVDTRSCIIKGLVRPKEGVEDAKTVGALMFTDIQKFVGLSIHAVRSKIETEGAPPPPDAIVGRVECPFGKTGKAKIVFDVDIFQLPPGTKEKAATRSHGGASKHADPTPQEDAHAQQDDLDGTEATHGQPQQQQRGGTAMPRIMLYFFSKKYPLAHYSPLMQ